MQIEGMAELRMPIRRNFHPRWPDQWPAHCSTDLHHVDGHDRSGLNKACVPDWSAESRHTLPARPKGAPIINFRSEGRRFPRRGRCLVPASHFFEFTGAKSPKSKWKFTKTGEDWFCFAGLWRPMPDNAGDAFTLLTVEPSPDVAPIHDRQMVVLNRSDWLTWLDSYRPEPKLLHPLPAGSLTVEQVR
jgi:putative SOS response-associated peptidase YedK